MPSLTQTLILCLREVITSLQRSLEHLERYAASHNTETPGSSETGTEYPDFRLEDPLQRCRHCAAPRVFEDRCRQHLTTRQADRYYGA